MEARGFRPALGLAVVLLWVSTMPAQFIPVAHPTQTAVLPQPRGPIAVVAGSQATPVAAPGRQHGGLARRHQPGAPCVVQSENFIVFASTADWAKQVAQVAEEQRRDLALYWLGQELPAWPQRCPLHVQDAENLGAGGETRFALSRGIPGDWMMSVQGTRERILDSVLPHEITHTIFATHFGRTNKYVPRWADEGAATTVEHEEEKKKHRHFLKQFLQTGRGLAFNEMFRLKEYPSDILPLYAQGHSAVQFLLDQAGPRQFVQFLETGMQTGNWPAALVQHYEYESIGDFQLTWNQWLKDGSPADILAYSPLLRRQNQPGVALASSGVGPTDNLQLVASNPSDSWYKRKLHSTSGASATPIPPHNHFSGDPGRTASHSSTATAQQTHIQSPGEKILR